MSEVKNIAFVGFRHVLEKEYLKLKHEPQKKYQNYFLNLHFRLRAVWFNTIEWNNGTDLDFEAFYNQTKIIQHSIASEPTPEYTNRPPLAPPKKGNGA